ncbi:hypothetical protein ABT354_34280 [Streptomyces sp. NPDC000594]|uniref:hypothetical protein n=1 Tax=unclassified Streptomyces TaxID=2593676 RepID=UPI003332F8FF
MADFRSEAIEVFETTRSSDTRGIIAALLHLADTFGPAGPGSPRGRGFPDWHKPALAYLQGKETRAKTAERIAQWLVDQGMEVSEEEVRRGMWDLVAAGQVKARTSGLEPLFYAVPERR